MLPLLDFRQACMKVLCRREGMGVRVYRRRGRVDDVYTPFYFGLTQ
jgi:hypothetical protein